MGLQYEPYFTNLNVGWETHRATGIPGLNKGTQEAIPILGKYSSYDVNIIRKHEDWFEYLGIDWLLIDWTNFLSMSPTWEHIKALLTRLRRRLNCFSRLTANWKKKAGTRRNW
jgi:hypothetical protein